MGDMNGALKMLLAVILGGAAIAMFATQPKLYNIIVTHLVLVPASIYLWKFRMVDWRHGEVGRALIHMARAIVLVMAVLSMNFWLDYPGETHVLAGARTYALFAVSYQLIVMNHVRHQALHPVELPTQRGRVP